MVRVKKHSRTVAAVSAVVALVLSSCGQNSNTASTTSVEDLLTASTVPPSTTVPWTPGAEVAAWEKFVEPFEILDVSQVSTGECGSRAMLVTPESLTMYWWNGVEWKDDTALLDGGRGQYPLKVYTYDYTNDGVLDFFVLYAEQNRPKSPTYGSFFAYTWALEEQCQWGWVDVDNGRTTTKTVLSPDVNPQNGRIFAPGFTRRRTSVRGEYKFLPSTSSFMYHEPVDK